MHLYLAVAVNVDTLVVHALGLGLSLVHTNAVLAWQHHGAGMAVDILVQVN